MPEGDTRVTALSPHHGSGPPWCLRNSLPSWEIGRPQPPFASLATAGAIRGRVLDSGCGTGEHTLMAAALGLDATGIDLAASTLRIARDEARTRGRAARFLRRDALHLAGLGEVFDTVLDSLVMHSFGAATRAAYLDGVQSVVLPGGRLFVLCYSDRRAGGPPMPHPMSGNDVESCFTGGWTLDALQPATCSSNRHPRGIPAWLATATRN